MLVPAQRSEQGFAQKFTQVGIFETKALGDFAELPGDGDLFVDGRDYLSDSPCCIVSYAFHDGSGFAHAILQVFAGCGMERGSSVTTVTGLSA